MDEDNDLYEIDNAMEMIGWALIGATVLLAAAFLWWLFK